MKLSDMLFANAMMGEGGGGGGSSDMSIAEITIINTSAASWDLNGAFALDADELTEGDPAFTLPMLELASNSNHVYKVILYKGNAVLLFPNGAVPEAGGCETIVTGNITYESGAIFVTGSGTITIQIHGD